MLRALRQTLARVPLTLAARRLASGKCEVNGHPIHYERVGSGPKHVLLLPGAIGCAATDFGPQLNGALSQEKYTILSWDPPGYGNSRPPERSWSDPEYFRSDAECALQLMRQLGIERYTAVGWSDGGNTALMMKLADAENSIDKLVVFGCNSYVSDVDKAIIERVRDLAMWSERMRAPMEKLYGPERFKELWSEFCDAFINYPNGGDICSRRLAEINVPTLIVHGLKDAMVDAAHHTYLHANIPNSRLVVWPSAKHNLHLRYPDEFRALVEEFLDN